MNHLGTVTIETPRLVLRRFTLEDAGDMFVNLARDDEVTQFLSWPSHKSVEDSRRVMEKWAADYEKDTCYQWCIELKETGKAIGSIGVVAINEKIDAAEIGYVIGQAWWHQGITSEAYKAVIDFLFRQVGFNRLAAHHDPKNPNSGKVMLKCGMAYEGTAVQGGRNTLGVYDCVMYGMITPLK